MIENVKISVGSASDVKILQTSIDRPDITFHIRPMQHSITLFKDLEFVVEAACERPIQAADILKDRFADAFAEISTTQVAKKVRNAIQRGDMNIARQLIQEEDIGAVIRKTTARRKTQREELEAPGLVPEMSDQHSSRRRCQQIPKTIIYMDSISHIELARQQIIH